MRAMPTDPPDGFVPSSVACELLGISDRTLRRRVQAGAIEGEYIPRPQGSVLYVRLPEDAAPHAAPDTAPRKVEEIAEESRGNPAPPDTRQDAALLAFLLGRIEERDAAVLAATERAARAEGERDAIKQAAEDAAKAAAERIAALEDVLAWERRAWWRKLLGLPPA